MELNYRKLYYFYLAVENNEDMQEYQETFGENFNDIRRLCNICLQDGKPFCDFRRELKHLGFKIL